MIEHLQQRIVACKSLSSRHNSSLHAACTCSECDFGSDLATAACTNLIFAMVTHVAPQAWEAQALQGARECRQRWRRVFGCPQYGSCLGLRHRQRRKHIHQRQQERTLSGGSSVMHGKAWESCSTHMLLRVHRDSSGNSPAASEPQSHCHQVSV